MPDFRDLANWSVRTLTPYQPGKPVEEVERELGIKSSIKLASNENPLGPSHKAIQAIQAVLPNIHIYPDGGCYEFKHALANFLEVATNQITVGNGSENILELIVKAYLFQNDTAIISQYAFLTIPILLRSYGVNVKVVPAKNYGHDVDAMVRAIDAKTRVIFLVNPNNPTGTYVDTNDFRRLICAVPDHILIVVDEAYAEYIARDDYPDTLSYLTDYPNIIVTRTFSKVYGLAALRLGYSISSPEIADILNRSRLPFNVNTIAVKAACAALADQQHVRESVAITNAGMRQLQRGLKEIELDYIPSVGNFITINVGDAVKVYHHLLHHGIIVRPLHAYHLPQHIRVTIGTTAQNQSFLSAMEKVCQLSTCVI